MNRQFFRILLIISFLGWQSCERKEPFVYTYETNPFYTQGYAEFWGAYYKHYDIDNHVLSLSLFTDSLFLDDENYLNGHGVYLNIDDIFFIPETDIIFPAGEYVVSQPIDSLYSEKSKIFGELMTISCGEQFNQDGIKYDFGTYVYFLEQLESFTIRKLVVGGCMTVSYPKGEVRIDFDFLLDDKTYLRGRFV